MKVAIKYLTTSVGVSVVGVALVVSPFVALYFTVGGI